MALKIINTHRHALTVIVHADRDKVDLYGGADFPRESAPKLLRRIADKIEHMRTGNAPVLRKCHDVCAPAEAQQ